MHAVREVDSERADQKGGIVMKFMVIALWLTFTAICTAGSFAVSDLSIPFLPKFCLVMVILFAELLFSTLMRLFWRDM